MPSERRYDIDWLRFVGIIGVFFLHTLHFFDAGSEWHLINAQKSVFILVLRVFIDVWAMPLFFLLAGAGTWFALRKRDSKTYVLERAKRLLVPFFTVGVFILLPPQLYFELVTHSNYTGTIWQLIPPTFDGPLRFMLVPNLFLNIWPGHLWFLEFLFEISIMTLPVLLYLRSDAGLRLIDRMAGWTNRWGGILLAFIPLALVRIALAHFWSGEHTWADLFYFAIFFLLGYIMPADQRFTESIKKHGWWCLGLGFILVCVYGVLALGLGLDVSDTTFSPMYAFFQSTVSLANLCFVVFMLSLGAKYLNFNNKLLPYATEAVLPFYILHQTIILCVGWYVIRLNWGIWPKFLLISAVSFVLIMATYELLVRRFNVTRFLFGMRPLNNQGRP